MSHVISVPSAGGTISAMYRVVPAPKHYIADVTVDQVSIGGQEYCQLADDGKLHAIEASFASYEPFATSPWGGQNAKTKGVNYLNYIFVDCKLPWNKEDWLPLLQKLNLKMVLICHALVSGDYKPPADAIHDIPEAVAFFKANGILCSLHTYSDVISEDSELAKDERNFRHDADGKVITNNFAAGFPTPAASAKIADNLARVYNECGFDGGIFFDALDFYRSAIVNDPATGVSFVRRVFNGIPGGCPIHAASELDGGALPLCSRYFGGIGDGFEDRLRYAADERAAVFAQNISQRVPFMGWLGIEPTKYAVADLEYFLAKAKSVGASYGISRLNPSNCADPAIAPYIEAFAAHNAAWNPRVITVRDAGGVPLPGVAVKVLDADGKLVFEGVTTTGIVPGKDPVAPGFVAFNLGEATGPFTIQTSVQAQERVVGLETATTETTLAL